MRAHLVFKLRVFEVPVEGTGNTGRGSLMALPVCSDATDTLHDRVSC